MSKTEINELLKKALFLETHERTAFLDQIEESELKQKIVLLLNDDTELTQFILKTSHGAQPLSTHQIKDLKAGDKINQFIIIKLIAKGGMGSVYMAYDEKLKRNVAIKTIRSEYIKNKATQNRFKQEAQILSLINHPSICQIYDYIDYNDGDMLVLELVDGSTLNDIHLSVQEKLNIFIQIASALEVAHKKNIIHRDLKPDNIMYTADKEIKILDFGIAKSTVLENPGIHSEESKSTGNEKPITKMGTLMGTLLYMSPEQAQGKEVTKASDIYSLGVIMQELLTGVSVYDLVSTKELKKQVILAETTHSELLPKSYQSLIAAMTQRDSENRPRATEVVKALKDIKEIPKRRFKKTVLFTVVILSILAFSKYTYDLNLQKTVAEQARLVAEQAKVKAENAKNEAEQVVEFLSSLFDQSNPYTNNGNPLTAREMLDEGANRIDSELNEQPGVLIKLKMVIGKVYSKLGLFPEAKLQFENAEQIYHSNHLQDVELLMELLRYQALIEMDTSNLNKAVQLQQKGLVLAEKNGLTKTESYLDTKYDLGVTQSKRGKFKIAKKIYNELLSIYQQDKESNKYNIIQLYNSLGMIDWNLKKLESAETLVTKALMMFSEDDVKGLEIKITVLNNLINISTGAGKHQQAIEYGLQSLQLREKILPNNHPDIALNYDNLAIAYCRSKQIKKCKDLNQLALEIYAKSVGKNHIDYAFTLANRAAILSLDSDYSGAVAALTETVNTLKTLHQQDHYDTAYYLTSLGQAYYYTDDLKNAIKYLKESKNMYQRLGNPVLYDVLDTLTKLARAYEKDHNTDAAIKISTEKLQLLLEDNQDKKAIAETQIKLKQLSGDNITILE